MILTISAIYTQRFFKIHVSKRRDFPTILTISKVYTPSYFGVSKHRDFPAILTISVVDTRRFCRDLCMETRIFTCSVVLLKGQKHEDFYLWFLYNSVVPGPTNHILKMLVICCVFARL